jgi:hypothetical protein
MCHDDVGLCTQNIYTRDTCYNVVKLGTQNIHTRDTCYNVVKLCTQNIHTRDTCYTTLGSIVNRSRMQLCDGKESLQFDLLLLIYVNSSFENRNDNFWDLLHS